MPCITSIPCSFVVGEPLTNNPPLVPFCSTAILYDGLERTGECVLPNVQSIKHRILIDPCCPCVMVCWFIDSYGTYKVVEFLCNKDSTIDLEATGYNLCHCGYSAKAATAFVGNKTQKTIPLRTKELKGDFSHFFEEFINSPSKILMYPITDAQSNELIRCEPQQIILEGTNYKLFESPHNNTYYIEFQASFAVKRQTVNPYL